MKRSLLIAVGLIIAGLAGVAGFLLQQRHQVSIAEDPRAIPESVIGQMRPEFTLYDKDGVLRDVKEWDGKILVINFWATWCPPCREEIPAFMQLQTQYADQDLQFVGIALQKADEVQEFVAELAINYPILTGEGEVIKLAEQLGNYIGALPYTVIIDRGGRIRFMKAGPLHYDEAEAQIKTVL